LYTIFIDFCKKNFLLDELIDYQLITYINFVIEMKNLVKAS
jgi:hypothetical protein